MKVTTKLTTMAGIAVGCLMLGGAPAAFAADAYVPPSEPAPAAASAPTPWSFGFEVSPEWKEGPGVEGQWADWYFKPSISYTFSSGFVWGGSFQDTLKPNDSSNNPQDPAYQVETTFGYKWKVAPAFTLTPAVGLGYYFGTTGFGGSSVNDSDLYWLVSLAGDWKLSKKWTWNVFNVRWRDAFNYKWATPKVATGVTYAITSTDSVYTNVGFGWKYNATADEILADKLNWAVGYKHAF